MKVLVAVASRHGATREIAHEIADRLRVAGHAVDVADPDDVEAVAPYDAVLVGSCVYVGRLAASVRAMADRLEHELVTRPLWLFSSGQVGFPRMPEEPDVSDADALTRRLHAREHRSFPGRLDRSLLTLAERAAVALLRAPEGDYRDWAEITAWADGVAAWLTSEENRRLHVAR